MLMHRLTSFGGEFASPEREATFQAERFPEKMRHTRLVLKLTLALNLIFVVSDARFAGTEHFAGVMAARFALVALTALALRATYRVETFMGLQRIAAV